MAGDDFVRPSFKNMRVEFTTISLVGIILIFVMLVALRQVTKKKRPLKWAVSSCLDVC